MKNEMKTFQQFIPNSSSFCLIRSFENLTDLSMNNLIYYINIIVGNSNKFSNIFKIFQIWIGEFCDFVEESERESLPERFGAFNWIKQWFGYIFELFDVFLFPSDTQTYYFNLLDQKVRLDRFIFYFLVDFIYLLTERKSFRKKRWWQWQCKWQYKSVYSCIIQNVFTSHQSPAKSYQVNQVDHGPSAYYKHENEPNTAQHTYIENNEIFKLYLNTWTLNIEHITPTN